MSDAADAPEKLKREQAGRYVSADGRFAVEQSSGRWLVVDSEQTDELGLPRVGGPFDTLDEARAAIAGLRAAPAASSPLAERLARGRSAPAASRAGKRSKPTATKPKPKAPQIELREFESGDGIALRELWASVGFRSAGDDDPSLRALAARNPGLVLVATADGRIVASALGAWDGRRAWVYHVATAPDFRRKGLAERLVRRIEQRVRQLGAPRLNAVVRDANDDGQAFWAGIGYSVKPSRIFNKEL